MVTAAVVLSELHIPKSKLYDLVTRDLVRAHPLPRLPHHQRPAYRFLLSEVREDLAKLPRSKALRQP
jgi:hypothetical protein